MPKRPRSSSFGARKRTVAFRGRRRVLPPRPRRRTQRSRRKMTMFPQGLPAALNTKLAYGDVITLVPTSGSVGQYIFRANSIFDPDFTGTGHQPRLHDQFSPLYNSYRVLGIKWRCSFFPIIGTEQTTLCVVAGSTSAGLTFGGLSDILEYPRPHLIKKTWLTRERRTAIISGYWKCSRMQGVNEHAYTFDEDYQAGFGSNPTATPLLNIYVVNREGTGTISIRIQVELTFYVRFFKPKFPSQS